MNVVELELLGVGGHAIRLEDVSVDDGRPDVNMTFVVEVQPEEEGRLDIRVPIMVEDLAMNENVPSEIFTGPIYGKTLLASPMLLKPSLRLLLSFIILTQTLSFSFLSVLSLCL